MPAVETSIWLAVKSQIETMPVPTGYEIAWPGVKFDPDGVNGYIRIGRIMASPSRVFIGDGEPHERTGFFIITLVEPMTQGDVSVYDERAGLIAQHFVDGTKMQYDGVCVSVHQYPHIADAYEDNGYWNTVIRIPWRCFA